MTRKKGEKMLKIQYLVFDGYKNRGGFVGDEFNMVFTVFGFC